MMNFYFKTSAGKVFVGCGKDIDRARSDAKRRPALTGTPPPSASKSGTPFKAFPIERKVK